MGRDLLPLPDILAAAGPQGLQLKGKLQARHPDSPLSFVHSLFFVILPQSHDAACTNGGGETSFFQARGSMCCRYI